MKRRVLFVTYGGGHAKIIRSLIDRIAERKLPYQCFVLGLTTSRLVLEGCEAEVFGFSDLVEPGDDEALRLGRDLVSRTPSNPVVCEDESVAYLGLSYHDLLVQIGSVDAVQQFAERGRQAFVPLGPLRRAIDRVMPELVVTTNSPRAEEAAIRVAVEKGIPSVSIVDLFGGFDLPRIADPAYGDKVCVLSDSVRETFIAAGRPPEDVMVTGNPAFDGYADPKIEIDASELRRSVGGRQIVLFASQPEPTDSGLSLRILNTISDSFSSDPNIAVFYRPHPSEHFDIAHLPDGVALSRQTDSLPELLKAAAVTVVISSTVGLEACLLGSTVVALTIPISMETAPYASDGMALDAPTIEELPRVIRRALSGEKPRGAKLPDVGSAADRVLAVLEGLLQA